MSFPDGWGSVSGGAECDNEGNYKAGCLITVIGNLTNPKVTNLTNNLTYKIAGTTSVLTLDSRNGGWEVKDNGVNIRYKRDYGLPILLSP